MDIDTQSSSSLSGGSGVSRSYPGCVSEIGFCGHHCRSSSADWISDSLSDQPLAIVDEQHYNDIARNLYLHGDFADGQDV